MSKRISVREARASLPRLLDRVAAGEQVVITRRGKPLARLIPEPSGKPAQQPRYPLRGSVLAMSKDFDEPIRGLWEALER